MSSSASASSNLPGNRQRPDHLLSSFKDHGSYHQAFERLLSATLLPTTATAFVTSGTAHPILDGPLGISLVMHSHTGFDATLTDYLHKHKFTILGSVMTWTLGTAIVGVWVGVYQFSTNDVGLTE